MTKTTKILVIIAVFANYGHAGTIPLPSGPFRAAIDSQIESDNSPGFQKAAAILKRSINESADPCEDFFELVSIFGGWEMSVKIF